MKKISILIIMAITVLSNCTLTHDPNLKSGGDGNTSTDSPLTCTGGTITQGTSNLILSYNGGTELAVNSKPLFIEAMIQCVYNDEYVLSVGFNDNTITTLTRGMKYQGTVPGTDITLEKKIVIEGNRIKFTFTRNKDWPAGVSRCDYLIPLAVPIYKPCQYTIDGITDDYPDEHLETYLNSGNRIECASDNPKYNLIFESDNYISLEDTRLYDNYYTLVFPMYEKRVNTFYLTLPETDSSDTTPALRFSQIGYPVAGEKKAYLEWPVHTTVTPGSAKLIRKSDQAIVKEAPFTPADAFMQFDYAIFDFSDITEPGEYKIQWGDQETGYFPITEHIFNDKWQDALDIFIPWQMCHAAVDVGSDAPAHSASHMDDGIRVPANFYGEDGFISYDCEGTPYEEGDRIDCTKGGFYDAGDYDLNVSSQSFLVRMLALAYEEFNITRDIGTLDATTQSYTTGSGDGIPDIIQMIEWGCYWILSMQQNDGRVYPGIVARPELFLSGKTPETSTNNIKDGIDDRHVYVDYHPDVQLKTAATLSMASRVLEPFNTELSAACLDAAVKALQYFDDHPEKKIYRPTGYFVEGFRDKGEAGSIIVALTELYITTRATAEGDAYLARLAAMTDTIRTLSFEGPSYPTCAHGYGMMYPFPYLARLYNMTDNSALKSAIKSICEERIAAIHDTYTNTWPFTEDMVGDYGESSLLANRVYEFYYYAQAFPDTTTMQKVLPSALWLFGLHPLNDYVFLTTDDEHYLSPNNLYNGQLAGRNLTTKVPGALVPGIGSIGNSLVFFDEPEYYRYIEASTYDSAVIIFALNALTAEGF